MKIDYAWQTHLGHLRPHNEDAWGARVIDPFSGPHSAWLLAVADGMGGHPGGEVASRTAISAVLEAGTEAAPDPEAGPDQSDRDEGGAGRPSGPTDFLRSLFGEASRRIQRRGRVESRYREMGTTLTVVYLEAGRAWVGHIGDTRLYWIRDDQTVQITRDHTMAQDLIEAGLLEVKASENHPASHVLTRCLGVCADRQPDLLLNPLRLRKGDRLLLASDGLVKVVSPDLLSSMVANREIRDAAELLLQSALNGGAPDNVTVVLASVTDDGGTQDSPEDVLFSAAPSLKWGKG